MKNYWLFKISDQGTYPDSLGATYVYDNTHSVRVLAGDEFIYLEKRGTKYGLSGAGRVLRVTEKPANDDNRRNSKVCRIFTAQLADVVWFSRAFDLSTRTKAGTRNRLSVGLPRDLNRLGWSISMLRLDGDLFVRLLDAALDGDVRGAAPVIQESEWRVEDAWSVVRRRTRMRAFRAAVLIRHDHTCLVCGTRLRSVLGAAHVRSYAADIAQRANPANGICLCSFCHTAYDAGDIVILPDGAVQYPSDLQDEIALGHFTAISKEERCGWLGGVEKRFLLERIDTV